MIGASEWTRRLIRPFETKIWIGTTSHYWKENLLMLDSGVPGDPQKNGIEMISDDGVPRDHQKNGIEMGEQIYHDSIRVFLVTPLGIWIGAVSHHQQQILEILDLDCGMPAGPQMNGIVETCERSQCDSIPIFCVIALDFCVCMVVLQWQIVDL